MSRQSSRPLGGRGLRSTTWLDRRPPPRSVAGHQDQRDARQQQHVGQVERRPPANVEHVDDTAAGEPVSKVGHASADNEPRGSIGPPAAAGLVDGGGVANLADRFTGGSVVDMFDVGWWPSFNLADVLLLTGVALILVSGHRPWGRTSVEPGGAPQAAPAERS